MNLFVHKCIQLHDSFSSVLEVELSEQGMWNLQGTRWVIFQESQLPVKIVASTNGWEDLSLSGWSQFYEVYALTHNDLLNVTMQELMSYFKSQISSWCLGT